MTYPPPDSGPPNFPAGQYAPVGVESPPPAPNAAARSSRFTSWASEPRSLKVTVVVLAIAAAVVVPVSGWYVYDTVISPDSGIAACEAFRDGKKFDDGVDQATGDKMTQAQYLQMRSVFQDSRHDDIRAAGTKMIDVLWQVQGLGDNPGLGALVYVGPMLGALTDFQSACANHNIVIKMPNMSGQ